jgi:aspartokinase-like uncharacterized kinase
LLAHEGSLETVLNVLADVARDEPLLIIPGGGPFADAVRDQDARLTLTADAAHWMAVLGMDQYAHLIVVADAAGGARNGRDRSVYRTRLAADSGARAVRVVAPRRSAAAFVGGDER